MVEVPMPAQTGKFGRLTPTVLEEALFIMAPTCPMNSLLQGKYNVDIKTCSEIVEVKMLA
jgi:hypothetical protein